MALASINAALAQHADNLNYEEDGVASARLFREAVRYLRTNRPINSTEETASTTFDSLTDDLKKVEAWLKANDTTKHVRFARGRAL